MTNNLFYDLDVEKQKQLFKIINFESKLDKKVIIKLDFLISNDNFVKENYKNFIVNFDINEQIHNIEEKANLFLNYCKDYTWNNIWNNFKKVIFEQKPFDDYYKCNIFFKWILLLIYLRNKEEINYKYFFLIDKKCKELFLNIGLRLTNYDKSKLINFSNEIILDCDNTGSLLKKIKDFYEQLDFFLIENISCLWNEFNFSYTKIKEKIQQNKYFFKEEKLSRLLINSDTFINNLTTVNNLNLPIIYIFVKYLIDNNFLLFKEKIVDDFLNIISKNLKIKNICLLKQEIKSIIDNNDYYQKNNNNYTLKLNVYGDNNFENEIIETIKMLIEDIPFN